MELHKRSRMRSCRTIDEYKVKEETDRFGRSFGKRNQLGEHFIRVQTMCHSKDIRLPIMEAILEDRLVHERLQTQKRLLVLPCFAASMVN
ncbi:hypothetical protein TNCV_929111 [Trichonephila clavipes]|nr:hypothetical protein TNCV_929111 [Trichonephila clavipes]